MRGEQRAGWGGQAAILRAKGGGGGRTNARHGCALHVCEEAADLPLSVVAGRELHVPGAAVCQDAADGAVEEQCGLLASLEAAWLGEAEAACRVRRKGLGPRRPCKWGMGPC